MNESNFPEGFLWGAATSSYQIEGAPVADGAGPSIWHEFSHTPGKTLNGEHGDIACDHYHRYQDDVRLMSELGLQAYRFSVSWSRVLPEGTGRVNEFGLDFYSRLVDSLLEHGITPFLTLYHWDLPLALQKHGGWLNREVADWFAEYSGVMAKKLGDRVPYWATLNEPWVVMNHGHLEGCNAPGHQAHEEVPVVAHNLLRAHARGVEVLRGENVKQVGLVVNLTPKDPATDSPEDIAAANRASAYLNGQFLDPVFLGKYPSELEEMYGSAWHSPSAEDMQLIQQPIDFVGVNYYMRDVMKNDPDIWPTRASLVYQEGKPHTEMGWEIHPAGLTETLIQVRERYGDIPIYITENGAAFDDPAPANGQIIDQNRIDYLQGHLRAASDAIEAGVPLKGYFQWSLMDNFEWHLGYDKRFGMVHVDRETLARTPKASARWYSDVIKSQGAKLFE